MNSGPAKAGHYRGSAPAPKKLTSAEVDIDEMRRTNHISLARVAANGAAPPGAQAWAVTSAFRRAPGRGCSRTGPATANAESPTEVARAPDESSQFLTWCSAMASRELLTRRDDRAYREYVREEQRSQPGAPTARTVRRGVERGCIAGRMQPEFHHGLLGRPECRLHPRV